MEFSAGTAGSSASSRRPRTRTAIHKTVFREGLIELNSGAGGRNRTDTLSPEQDFESSASTSSATPAIRRREFPRALHLCCTQCGHDRDGAPCRNRSTLENQTSFQTTAPNVAG